MGILTRFKDIMSANINALLDKAEDPGKMLDQCMRDLQSDLGKVKAETAAVMADAMRAKRVLDETSSDIEKMQTYATKSVAAGNDSDAKKFLEKKAALTMELESNQQAFQVAQANADKMKAMHDKLNSDIIRLESRRDTIKNKLTTAETLEQLNQIGGSMNGANNTISAFEKYEALAESKLDKANAMAELNAKPTTDIDQLARKYDEDSTESANGSIDDQLAALKASMQKEGGN